jgi:hypothetical protein
MMYDIERTNKMNIRNSNGRMIWSGKAGEHSPGPRCLKSRFRAISLIFILTAIMALFLTTSVYASPGDVDVQDIYAWSESYFISDDDSIPEGYIWGESCSIDIGEIWGTSFGYAWGE